MKNSLTYSLKNLNALVCGSTSGIGKSTALELANNGANVTLFARDKDKIITTFSDLPQNKKQSHNYLIEDFDKPDEIRSIIASHIENGNKYHILINNSGGPSSGSILNANTNDFLTAFNRHLICNHILFQTLFSGMKELKYGRIINIISTSVKQPIIGLGVSNTIRGAVASWSKTLSLEIASNGITVNNILPGFTKTNRLSKLIENKAIEGGVSIEEIKTKMESSVPAKRFAEPEETAKAISFLVSPVASYINGVSLAVDGGRISCI